MIYFIGNGLGQIKIGYSVNPLVRLSDLQTASPSRLELLAILPGKKKAEKEYHKKYSQCNISGEWFQANDALLTEIQEIKENHGIELPEFISNKMYKNILFNKERDKDILDWLESQDNQAEIVRKALHSYMVHKGVISAEITSADVLDEVKKLSEQLANIKVTQITKSESHQEPPDLVAKLKNFGI